MYNIFEVYPEDMRPNREYFIGSVKTKEEAEEYKNKWEQAHPRKSSWHPYIIIRKIEFMEI